MADPDDDHHDPVVVDSIQDSVVTNPNAPSRAGFAKQLRTRRSGVPREAIDRTGDAAPNRLGQVRELARS